PGPIVIDVAVDLVGLDRPVIDGGGAGTVLTLRAGGSRVAGFLIRGTGDRSDREDAGIRAEAGPVVIEDNRFEDVLYGINLKQAPDSLVARNVVRGRDIHIARRGDGIRIWESHGTRILDNQVLAARDVVIWYSEGLLIRGNTVREGRYGLHYMYSHDSRIEANRLERNAVGAFLMYSHDLVIEGNVMAGNHGPSGYGLALKDSDDIQVLGNVLAGNRVGLYLDGTPSSREARGRVARNHFAFNDIGVLLLPTVARNRFEANSFVENEQQVALSSRGSAAGNDWTPDGQGNYWSDYAGYDAGGDGFGDLPYQPASLFHELLIRQPELRLFALGPVHGMLDLAARAFPVFRPPALLSDTAPRTRPLPPPVAAPRRDGRPLAGLALALIGLACLVVAWGRGLDGGSRRGAHRSTTIPERGPA
ncbi:MAG: nitrous oxide reductase family maturation protein NosD, partial [Chloroflexi bacterium]|nr:nitrous oxide reductase family maturation protein NosD [Chloroflexota bacterium]